MVPPFFVDDEAVLAGQIVADAQQMQSTGDDNIVLSGDVRFQRAGERVSADRIEHFRESGDIFARGNVVYSTPDLEVKTQTADVNTKASTVKSGPAQYRYRLGDNQGRLDWPQLGHGSAKRVTRTETGIIIFDDADYTNCPADQPGWHIAASSLTLDPNEAEGTATGASLWFKGVPLLYVPWFRFPIGDVRKSGFLVPRFGVNSANGSELSTPWYWNIAPQADATLTPHYMSERGLALESEWRYQSRTGYWQLDNEYLDEDDKTNTRRHFSRLRHAGQPFSNWTTSIDASDVSDPDYFDDFGDSLDLTGTTHLERRADITHRESNEVFRHTFVGRVQNYQTVDETIAAGSRPYQRLPQITYDIDATQRPGGFAFDIDSELVKFDRNASVTAERLDLRPRIRLPIERTAGFFRPSLSVWHTRYKVDNSEIGGEDDVDIERTIPVFSLDTGLFFERAIAGGKQTLEPRLYYLRVPFEDQSTIPTFDSGTIDLSFDQLFRENRFSGADRVGDARQLSLALTTRFVRDNGREYASASIGQIHYLDDRRVALSGTAVDTAGRSDIVLDLRSELDEWWRASTTVQWDPRLDESNRSTTQLAYTGTDGDRFSITHRYRVDDHDQVDLSFGVPLKPHWRISGRWNYELDDEHNIDSNLALEYQSCCWAFRAVARQYLTDNGTEQADSLYFELVMKGLGSLGDNTDGFF